MNRSLAQPLAAAIAGFAIVACVVLLPAQATTPAHRCQRAYLGHGARFWYRVDYRIRTGRRRANVELQRHPARFRRYGCPASVYRGAGPERWHYRAAVRTARARARRRAMLYRTPPVVAVRAALTQLGVPYLWGGESAGHWFDCSGLVQWAYAQAGVALPRTTFTQRYSGHVVYGSLHAGDLLFFGMFSHVAIYAGNSEMIEAPHTGAVVRLVPVRPFVMARRVA